MGNFPAGPDYSNPLLSLLSGVSGFSQGLSSGMSNAAQMLFQRAMMQSEMARNQAMAGYYQARPGLMAQTNSDRALYQLGYDPVTGQTVAPGAGGLLGARQQTADAATQRADDGHALAQARTPLLDAQTLATQAHIPVFQAMAALDQSQTDLNNAKVPTIAPLARSEVILNGARANQAGAAAGLDNAKTRDQAAMDAAAIRQRLGVANLDNTTAGWLGPKTAAQIAADRARATLDTTNATLAPGLAGSLEGYRGAMGGAATENAATNAGRLANTPGVVNGPGPGKGLLPDGLTPQSDQALAKEFMANQTKKTSLVAAFSNTTDPNVRAEINRQLQVIDARNAQIQGTRARVVPMPLGGGLNSPATGALPGFSVVPVPGVGQARVPTAPALPGAGGAAPANPYLSMTPAQLRALAQKRGYRVK